MNNIEIIISLLSQQYKHFCEYEMQTNAILSGEIDAVDNYITKRSELAIEIDKIGEEINEILLKSEDSTLKSAVKCEENYDTYTADYIKVYSAARELYACISRVGDKNSEIIDSMTIKREELRTRLQSTKNTPKIKKYLGALGSQATEGIFTGNDKKA